MRPLSKNEIGTFLSRFERFTGSEIKSITVLLPTVIEIRVSAQDSALSFDWIDLSFELSNVSDANLIDNTKLAYLDMSEGVSIIFEDNLPLISFSCIAIMATLIISAAEPWMGVFIAVLSANWRIRISWLLISGT